MGFQFVTHSFTFVTLFINLIITLWLIILEYSFSEKILQNTIFFLIFGKSFINYSFYVKFCLRILNIYLSFILKIFFLFPSCPFFYFCFRFFQFFQTDFSFYYGYDYIIYLQTTRLEWIKSKDVGILIISINSRSMQMQILTKDNYFHNFLSIKHRWEHVIGPILVNE